MKRLWILLLITIVTVLLPQKMLADIKLKNMFVWDETYTSASNEISSSTSGWAPGTYSIQLKLKNGWAGENCTLRIQKFEKKNRIVISQEYVVLKQLDKYWSQETFGNITFPSNTDNNGIGIYFQKVTKVNNQVAMIDAGNCYATLKFDFDALRSQLTTLLDETKVYIDMLPASTKQTYTSQYNGLKTIVDALQNDASNASEVYSYYTQYKLWLGVSENDLGKEIQNLKNGAMTAAYPAVVEEVRKTFKSADSLQIQTRKTVDSWLDVTSLSDPKKSCYDAIRSKAYSRLGDVYTEMVAIARDLTAFAGHGATSDQDYVKNTRKNLLYRISAQTTELTSILTAVTTRKKNVDDAVSKYDELINTKNEYEQNSVFNRLIDGKYQNLVSAWEAFVGAADAVKKKIEGADYDVMGTLDVTDLYNTAVEKKAALEKIFSEEKKKDETFSSYATNIEELRTYYNAWGSLTAEQKRYEAGKPLSDYVGTKYSNLESHLTGLKNALDEARATKPALTDLFFQGKDTEGSFSYKLAKAKEAIDAFFDQVKGLAQKYNSVMDTYNTARLDLATAKGLVEGRYIYANTQYNKDNYNYKTAIEDCESYHATFQSSVDAALNKKDDEHIAAINALAYDATRIAAIKARVTEEHVAEDLKGYMADMQVKFFADLSKISEYKGQILTGDEAADKQTYGLSYTDLKSTYDTIDKEIDVTTARKQYESGTDAERTALQNKVTEALKKWADLLVSASQTKAKVATNKTLYEQALSDLSAINWTADGAQKEIVDAAGAAYTQGTNGEKTAVDGSISQITADVNKLDSDIKSAYQKETMEADYASLSASLHAIKTAITTAKTSAQALNSNYAAYQDVLRRINSAKNSCETDIKHLDTSMAGDDYSALRVVSKTDLQKYVTSLETMITSNENYYKKGKSVSEKLSFISAINRVQLYIQDAETLARNRKSRLSNSLSMLQELESKLNTIKTNYSAEYAVVTDEKTKVDTDISSIKTTISTANSGDCSGLDKLNVKDAYNTALTDIDKLLEACKAMRTDNEKAAAVSAARAKVSQLTTAFNTARNAVKQAYTTVGGSGYYTTIETGISSDIEALPAAIDAKEADSNVKSTDDFFKGADTPGSLEAQIAAITTRITTYQANAEEAAKNYLAVKSSYQQGGYAVVAAKALVENLAVYTIADYNKDRYDYKTHIEEAEAYIRSIQTALGEALKKTGDEHVTAMKALVYDDTKASAITARVTEEKVTADLKAYRTAYDDLLGNLEKIKEYKGLILSGNETTDAEAYGLGYNNIKTVYTTIDGTVNEADVISTFSNGTEAQRTALKATLATALTNWANLLVTANDTKSKVATNKTVYDQAKGELSAINWTDADDSPKKQIVSAAAKAYTDDYSGTKAKVDGLITEISTLVNTVSSAIETAYKDETMKADFDKTIKAQLETIRTKISEAITQAQQLNNNYIDYLEEQRAIKDKADAIASANNKLQLLKTMWTTTQATIAGFTYGDKPVTECYSTIPQGIADEIAALEAEVRQKENDTSVTGLEDYFTKTTEGTLTAKVNAIISRISGFKSSVETTVSAYNVFMAQLNQGKNTVASAKAMVANLPIYNDYLNNVDKYNYRTSIEAAESDLQAQSQAAAAALTKKDAEHQSAIAALTYDGTKASAIAARVTKEQVQADMDNYLKAADDLYGVYNSIISLQKEILSGDEAADKATYGTYYAELKADYDKINVPTREEVDDILADGSSDARDKLDADLAAASSALTALLVKASTWKSLNTLNEMAKEYADGEIAALKWTERQKEIIEAAGEAYTKGTNDEKNSLDNLLGTIGTAIKTLQDDIEASYKKGTLAGDFQNGYSERLDNIRTSIVEADAFADAQKANYDAYKQVADQAATVRTAYEKAVSTLEKSLEGDAYATLLTAAKASLTGMLASLNSIESDNKADYQAGNCATNSITHLKKLQELNASISESVQQKTDWKANLDAANQSLKDLNDRLADVESNYQDVLALCETEHTAVMDAIQAMKAKVDKAYSGDCSGLEGFSLSTDYAEALNALSTLTTALNSHRTDNQTKADAIENARDRLEQLGTVWMNAKSTIADYRYGTAPALERYTAIPQGIDNAIKALETEVDEKEKDGSVTGTEPYFTGDADTEGSLAAKISAVVSDIDKFKTTVETSVDKYDTYMAQVNEGLKTVAAARTLVASLPIYTDYLNNKGQYRYKVALDEAEKDLQTQSAAAAEALTKKDAEHQAAIDALKYDGTKVDGIADRVTEEQVKADMEVYQDQEEDLLGVYTSILSLQTQILSGDETADKATYGIYYDDLKVDYDKIVVPTREEINEILAGGSSSAREKLEADLEEINGKLTTLLVRASKLKVQVQVNDATYSHVLSEIDGFEWTENGMQKSVIAAAGDAYTKGTNGEKAAVDGIIKAITDRIGSLTEAVKASHGQGTMYDDYTAKYKDQITAIHTDISNAGIQAAALAANYKSYVAGNDRLAEVAADLKKAQTDAAAVDNADGYRAGTTFYAEKELAETMQTRLTEAGETLKARYEEGKAEEGQAEVTALLQQLDNDINNVPVRAQANFTAYKTLESLGYETSDIIFIVKSVLNSNDKSSKRDSLIAVLDTYQQKTDSAMTANLELYQNGQLEKQSQSETAIEGMKTIRAQVEDLINNALINYAAQIEADNAAMLDRIKQEGATAKETMVTVKTTVTEYNEVMENVAGAAELKTIFYFMTLLDKVAPAEIEDILRTAQEDYDDVRASAEVDVFDADTLYYKSLKALDELAKASIATFVELYRNDNDVNRYLLTQQTDSLQTLFDKVRAYIETYCPDVSKPYLLDTLPEIQALIDAAVAYVSEQYEQGALNGDSRIDFEEIAALLEEKRAHAEAEQREFGDFITNKTALDRLRGELDAIQKILDEVKEMLDLYKYDGIEDDDMEYARLQEALDRLSEELSERYKNHELDEHSTIDSERLRTDAVALRDKVLSKIPQTGIDGVGSDGNEVICLDATGHRVEQPLKGQVIIIRQKNGATRKVIWKQDGNE